MEEFASQSNIKVWYKDAEIMHLSLKGSMAALNEVLRCQDAVNAALAGGSDGSDPFAN